MLLLEPVLAHLLGAASGGVLALSCDARCALCMFPSSRVQVWATVQETRLLQTIDRLKRTAMGENKNARIDRTLRGLANPKQWALSNGRSVSVHTPLTIRARELMHLYHGLTLPLVKMQERLDVLLHVKWTVKEFDCNLTREIVDLVCLSPLLSWDCLLLHALASAPTVRAD